MYSKNERAAQSIFQDLNRLALWVLSALILTSIPASLRAQNWIPAKTSDEPAYESVDAILSSFEHPDEPGAAVAIVQNGELSFVDAFGKSSLELGTDLTPESVFNVASIAKQFTAFAIALLEDRGDLSLDDDIRKYLPETPKFDQTITIRHLVHHISGLRDDLGMLFLSGWGPHDLITSKDVSRMVARLNELDYEPGTRHLYSNTNYSLLAIIVERVSGQSFESWTRENIFDPIGMTSTNFATSPESVLNDRAQNYDKASDGSFTRRPNMWYNAGPGSLYSSVLDLAKWMQNMNTGRVGGKAVAEKMRERGVLNDGTVIDYAFGLGHGENLGLPMIAHSGSGPGVQAYLRMYPEQDFAVVTVSNTGDRALPLSDLTQKIVDFHLGQYEKENVISSGGRRMMMITDDQLNAAPSGSFEADPESYDALEGSYELKGESDDVLNELLIIISRDDKRLLLSFGQPPGIPLTPIGENKFSLAMLGAEIDFKSHNGNVLGLEFIVTEASPSGQARTLTGAKMSTVKMTHDELQDYAGTYYSSELETIYKVRVAGEHLVVSHLRHGDFPLSEVIRDEFLAEPGSRVFTNASFTRDHDNQVVSMYLKGYSWSSGAELTRIDFPYSGM